MIAALVIALLTAQPAATPSPAKAAPAGTTIPTPSALPAANQASHERGLAFARAYVPAEKVTNDGLRGARESFQRGFNADAQGVALEQRYPGARAAALAATERAVAELYAERLPMIHDRIASFITPYFSNANLAAVTAFIGSPTGQSIQSAVGNSASYERLAKGAYRETGEVKIESTDLLNAIDPGFIGRLSSAQIAEFAAFNTSPPGRRFNQVAPSLLALVAAETTAMINEGMAGVQTKVMQAVADHVRAKPKP